MKYLVCLVLLFGCCLLTLGQGGMVTKHLYDFATPDGGGYPNDEVNDHQAFVDAAAFFQARHGYGTLILEDGEYIIGKQELRPPGNPPPPAGWAVDNYPSGGNSVSCPSMVAIQPGFTLTDCAQFTLQGGANTTVRYRSCLYYGAFKRNMLTDEVFRPLGPDTAACRSCQSTTRSPDLVHAAVGVMFTFQHCDSVNIFDVELDGNVDSALVGSNSSDDGIQTGYDGIYMYESSRWLIRNVHAHHFGRDGLNIGSTYQSDTTIAAFRDLFPDLNVTLDPVDTAITYPGNVTVLFHNRVENSQFNWNSRQGISWTGCSKLAVSNCDMHYNGAGRFWSSPASGLDIEGGGGAMRVRYGTFDDCRFLHNLNAGVLSDNGQCNGQQDFRFNRCVVKAGESGTAVWAEARAMKFDDCQIYGRVEDMFEQAENIERNAEFDLRFNRTNFYEEDDQWCYLSGYPDSTWSTQCAAGGHKFDMVNAGHGRIHFDSCGFYTNCRGNIRFKGRCIQDANFPYCASCSDCHLSPNNCAPGTCALSGPYLGTDSLQDDRYVTVTNSWFVNTGRKRCGQLTQVISGDYATIEGLAINIPTTVREGGSGDDYWTPFGTTNNPGPPCGTFCDGYTVDSTEYAEFPPCRPFYTPPITDRWASCPQAADERLEACYNSDNCWSERTLADSTLSSSLTSPMGGTVYIQGRFIVDQAFIFEYAEVRMAPGAEIIVQEGIDFQVLLSTVRSCSGVMWKSITAMDGAIVQAKNSVVKDAESGITALNSSIVLATNVEFSGNRVGIAVPPREDDPFNNVVLVLNNCTFHSADGLAQPYPGQGAALGEQGFAAIEAYNAALDLTGQGNVIHDLSNGMALNRCDAVVEGWTLHDIQPDAAYASDWNGSGIYAHGDKGSFTLKQSGFGMAGPASFTNCRWGLYTEFMNVKSWDNRMKDVGTAYRVEHSGYREVDLLNNRISALYEGIDLRFNDGAAHVLVEGNEITFGKDESCTACRGYSGIRVSEANTQNLNSVIRGNVIHFVALAGSRTGINLNAASDWLVQGNQIEMASRFHSRTGVRTGGCERVQVSCNEVTNADALYAQYPQEAQAGIRNWMGQDALISCNTVDKTTNGILFSGGASGTVVRGNEFHNHLFGLHLEGDAVIGEQELTGNLWFEDAAPNGYQAWNQNPNNPFFVQFKVNSTNPPSGAVFMPSSVEPPQDWFIEWPGANYDCSVDNACLGFKELCANCSGSLWQMVADGSLENGAYTSQTRWIMKGDLYKWLTEEPELLEASPELQDFYDEVEDDVLAQLKQLDMEQLALYDLDASVADALVQGAEQMGDLRAQLQTEVIALGDANLTPAQRQAHARAILGLQASIGALLDYHGAALQLAADGRAVSADAVNATNASVAAGELIEQNHKTVNEIYLSTIAQDVSTFSSVQAEALFTVANQCPLTGGNAVFRARSLYSLIDDAHEFDDEMLCLQQGLITKRAHEEAPLACIVIPNPAHEQATLVLQAPLTEQAWLVLANALNAEVMNMRIPIDQSRTAFGTEGLAPGIYHYTLRNSLGILGHGRLAIEH